MGNNSTKLAKETAKVAVPRTNIANRIETNPEMGVAPSSAVSDLNVPPNVTSATGTAAAVAATTTRNVNAVTESTSNPSSIELNNDILKEISKWQATKKPPSQPSNIRSFESVHVIRMKKENQLKSLTELGSPPGLLTEEKLHEFFKEFRDNPNQDVSNIAKAFYLDEKVARQLTRRSRLPVITKDSEEEDLSIAHVWDR